MSRRRTDSDVLDEIVVYGQVQPGADSVVNTVSTMTQGATALEIGQVVDQFRWIEEQGRLLLFGVSPVQNFPAAFGLRDGITGFIGYIPVGTRLRFSHQDAPELEHITGLRSFDTFAGATETLNFAQVAVPAIRFGVRVADFQRRLGATGYRPITIAGAATGSPARSVIFPVLDDALPAQLIVRATAANLGTADVLASVVEVADAVENPRRIWATIEGEDTIVLNPGSEIQAVSSIVETTFTFLTRVECPPPGVIVRKGQIAQIQSSTLAGRGELWRTVAVHRDERLI